MAAVPDDPLAAAERSLAAADWPAAKAHFEEALRAGETAEALSGLGYALFWLGDMPSALSFRERGYLAFRERGDAMGAARLALWLAGEHAASGNDAVANGWANRAERLIGELACAERGWLLLRRSRQTADPLLAADIAGRAIELAQALNDRDLEVAAISRRGRALLSAGRVEQGFACLDEAMAAATSGEVRNIDVLGDTCCDMIAACERTAETARAVQWCRVSEQYAQRFNFLPMFAFCRVTYASVLLVLGRFAEAEREIDEALRSYRASFVFQAWSAIAKLAELRLLQGRDAEAEELLVEYMHHPGCTRAVALLHLARGDGPAAARVLSKRIGAVEHDRLLLTPLVSLLVEAELAAGQLEQAAATAQRLSALAIEMDRAAFRGLASFAAGLVALARRDPTGALARFESASALFVALGMPLLAARARLGAARCLVDSDARAAKAECRAALGVFEELGAKRDIDAAAALSRALGDRVRRGPRGASELTKREQEVLALLGLGLSNAKIAARLYISPKTVEHHVGRILQKLDLESRAAAAAFVAKTRPHKPGAS